MRKEVISVSLALLALMPMSGSCKSLVIGDSHAQGMSLYCKNKPPVHYKVGSTTKYWINQNPIYGLDNLYIVTGANDGVSPTVTEKLQSRICDKWQPKRCNHISTRPSYPTYDGVHFKPQGYRNWCNNIFY